MKFKVGDIVVPTFNYWSIEMDTEYKVIQNASPSTIKIKELVSGTIIKYEFKEKNFKLASYKLMKGSIVRKMQGSECNTVDFDTDYIVTNFQLFGKNRSSARIQINNPKAPKHWYNVKYNFFVKENSVAYNQITDLNNVHAIILNSSGNISKTINFNNLTNSSASDNQLLAINAVEQLLIQFPLESFTIFYRGKTASYDRPPVVWR